MLSKDLESLLLIMKTSVAVQKNSIGNTDSVKCAT